MSERKNQHVIPFEGRWSVRSAGAVRASRTFDSRQDAIAHARERARRQGTVLYIHGTDGRVHERDSFERVAESSSE